ncbi:aminotransferase class V-fold PLP-dependent enzyme [Litchfieldia salsa]|uniref:Aspartate aminotransferase n=1 Tax=Litchfieldia salsa TaxID=930152 RepID=A0A1H0Q9N7_9BACI|nr:aminotransferase class V-fold PLP-dependent enzyme [Litchfieldia salsa]SDP14081.1 aspartate aminotransferase [Litchfieldia salsa]
MGLIFKVARTEHELDQIHRLNYATFVEEIPQHSSSESKLLIDKYHTENTYLICMKDDQLVGMLAVRDQRPFSIDQKIGRVEEQLPVKSTCPCEIRLLTVKKEHRNGRIFLGLSQLLANYCLRNGYDVGVISGTTRQIKLYEQIGFIPFHHLVGTESAMYQPMYMTREIFEKGILKRLGTKVYSFLPGPTEIEDRVKKAFPVSHRSQKFRTVLANVQMKLSKMMNAEYSQVLLGSGSLANDVIVNQMRKEGKGLILVNGEFGQRLVIHAERAGVDFVALEWIWGESYVEDDILKVLERYDIKWVWMVHCETSTGMLNSLEFVKGICKGNELKLCVDCISSIGSVPISLEDVFLASGVSGKAIGAYTGLSFVFHHHQVDIDMSIPGYLDLGHYFQNESVPYSHSSNLIDALLMALELIETTKHFERIKEQYDFIRSALKENDIPILTDERSSSPTILTIPLPVHIPSKYIGDDMSIHGYLIHYESGYLNKQNWIQISPIGYVSKKTTEEMIKRLLALRTYYERSHSEVIEKRKLTCLK